MCKIRRGEIYLANLSNNLGSVQAGSKRPVLVLSNDIGNAVSPIIIVVPLTTKIEKKRDLPTHVTIRKDDYSALRYDSVIMVEQIITIDKKQLLGDTPFFRLQEKDMKRIEQATKISLGLQIAV